MPSPLHLPEITDAERTALVERLVVLIEALAQENQRQVETIQQLRDEIAVLKSRINFPEMSQWSRRFARPHRGGTPLPRGMRT